MLVPAAHEGVVINVRLLSISFDHVSGNYSTIFPDDGMGFLGVSDTISFDRVNIVACWADILHDENVPGEKLSLGR